MPLLTASESNYLPLEGSENTPHFQQPSGNRLIGSSSEDEITALQSDRQYESPKFFIGDTEPKDNKVKEALVIQTGEGNHDLHGQSCDLPKKLSSH